MENKLLNYKFTPEDKVEISMEIKSKFNLSYPIDPYLSTHKIRVNGVKHSVFQNISFLPDDFFYDSSDKALKYSFFIYTKNTLEKVCYQPKHGYITKEEAEKVLISNLSYKPKFTLNDFIIK